jgi:hypothetical protein
VRIRFVDGGTLRFLARDFDINAGGRLPPEAKPKRYACTDATAHLSAVGWGPREAGGREGAGALQHPGPRLSSRRRCRAAPALS